MSARARSAWPKWASNSMQATTKIRARNCRHRAAAAAFVLLAALVLGAEADAQGWQADSQPATPPSQGNVTIVPRSPGSPVAPPAATTGGSQLSLTASMTEDGQVIDQGLVWRVYRDKPGSDGKPRLVSINKEAAPQLKLDAGDYVINVAYGRANLTRKIAVPGGQTVQERFVLNAGGLRTALVVPGSDPIADRATGFDVYSDERDQAGQRRLLISGVKPGMILRLNAGIYSVVSTYGDANAVARAEVAVEAGKLTEVTLTHQGAKVTLRLVARLGGEAIADTQWMITTRQGEIVKESVGALPSHILAPGAYIATAKNAGLAFQREFVVQPGQAMQVEVVRR